jgi:hypothetical protein
MATNAAIRSELVDTLSDIAGLNVMRYPADNVSSPAAVIAGFSTVQNAFGGQFDTQVDIYVVVSHRHIDQFEQLDALTDFTGFMSIPQTLNDRVVDAGDMSFAVVSVGDYREMIIADAQYYGATVTLKVYH